MSSRRDTLVGYVLWNGGKWYLKQLLRSRRAAVGSRLPSRRASLLVGLGGLSALVATAVLIRRLAG